MIRPIVVSSSSNFVICFGHSIKRLTVPISLRIDILMGWMNIELDYAIIVIAELLNYGT